MPYWKFRHDYTIGDGGYNEAPSTNLPDDFSGVEAPKLNFSFTVGIELSEAIATNIGGKQVKKTAILGSERPEEMVFAVQRATRPSPTVNYTDANYYNHRTKVATSVDYGTTTITFFDDSANRAHDIYSTYLTRISPISRVQRLGDLTDSPKSDPFGQWSTLGPLDREQGFIKAINLYHYYRFHGAEYRKTYTYINPKIVNFVLDDLDMTTSAASTVQLSFNCDGMFEVDERIG